MIDNIIQRYILNHTGKNASETIHPSRDFETGFSTTARERKNAERYVCGLKT